jgi:alkylation response protein AidB-like acyl-CoA dehydrogenase
MPEPFCDLSSSLVSTGSRTPAVGPATVDLRLTTHDYEARARELGERFAERAPEYDRTARFPEPNLAELRAAGLLGLTVPVEAGGAGAEPLLFARVTAALAEGCGATALMFTMHHAAIAQIGRDGLAEQRARWFAEAAAGRLFGIAISDAAADAGPSGVTTIPEGTGWRLKGRKSFVTGAAVADGFVASVAAADGTGFMAVLPRAGTPGIAVRETWDAMGIRASASHDLVLDGLRLNASERLGPREEGPDAAFCPNGIFQIGFAATSVGIAAAARKYLRSELCRRAGGDPARLSQSARFSLAEVETAVAAARALLYHAAVTLAREGESPAGTAAVNSSKLFANRTAIEVADTAMQAIGGRAYLRTYPLERLCRDARAGALMRNTLDQCREEIARAVLGMGGGE